MPFLERNERWAEDYRNLFNMIPYAAAVFRKADGRIVTANRQFWIDLGLTADETPQTGSAGPHELYSESANQGESTTTRISTIEAGIIQFETPDGRLHHLKADVQTVQFGGQECRLVTNAVDTPSKTPLSSEIRAEESYRDMVENLNDILYTTDDKAVVTYVSPNVTQLSGYDASEVIGKNFTEFVHPDDLSGRIDQFLKILGGANEASEYRLVIKSGAIKWIRTSARPILRNGRVVGVQGILVDISDQKEIEEALRCSEEKYRLLVQHAMDAIFVVQGDYIKFMNPRASEILGCAFDSIADRPFWEFVHPDDRASLLDRYKMRLSGKSLSDRISFRMLNITGEIRDVDMNSVLITWEEKPAVLNFLRDITLQKLMETQLRNSQRMEALGTLAGGIAHNFNNLLMGIHGNVSLAQTGLAPSTDTHAYLEKIIDLVQSGSRMTDQLLHYARRGTYEVSSVDLNRLIRDVSEALGATKKQIRLHHKLSNDLPSIKADRGQIEQVLLNLLLNAADAMPDGGNIFIETSCAKGIHTEANQALCDEKDYVLLKVSDQGTGIPPNILDRIFEPFFTTKESGRGTGLGLSTAYGIVKNHKGEISVESVLKKGSCFFVYLPAFAPNTTESGATNLAASVQGHGTILLVDDETTVIEPSSKLLEHLGFTVFKASSGLAALEIFQEHWKTINLVILDIILPKMSGKELYYKLKEIDPQVKVLLSSGYNLSGQAQKLLDDGCRGFIQKPYDINQLSTVVMDILSAG